MVEERPGQSELGAQVFPQRLDPDGLRRVVPAIEDVDTQLFGIEERMVRPFTRDVGVEPRRSRLADHRDRKSTRLNSSHSQISYAVFCLKKKKTQVRHL